MWTTVSLLHSIFLTWVGGSMPVLYTDICGWLYAVFIS